MSASSPIILVAAATGRLGTLVVRDLLERVPPAQVVAGVRDPAKAEPLERLGVAMRRFDYDDPATLDAALADVDRLLLVSSTAMGRRATQHRNVVRAASDARVGFVAYTSLLHADTSPMHLAEEHRATEADVRDSGMRYALLRNGWYTENFTATARAAVDLGAVLGCSGDGRISSAARADYAAAAAIVLATERQGVFELAGDTAYTKREYAAELARVSQRDVAYRDLSESAYRDALLAAHLPAEVADLVADCDAATARGALFDDGRELGAIVGRPTTPMRTTVEAALS